MLDLIFIALTLALFAILGLAVRGGAAVSLDNAAGLVIAVALLVLLVVSLIFPERF